MGLEGLGGFYFWSVGFGEEKTFLLLTGIQIVYFGFTAHILVNLQFIEGAIECSLVYYSSFLALIFFDKH
jgi:hypothetical protein